MVSAIASAPASPMELPPNNNLWMLLGRLPPSDAVPRSSRRLPVRLRYSRPSGNRATASKATRFPSSWSSRRPAGRPARSASAPMSSIKLLSRNSLTRPAGSLPANQTAPWSPMRLFLSVSCTIPTGNLVSPCMASRAMRLLLSWSTCVFAGRLARSASAPMSSIKLLSSNSVVRPGGSLPANQAAPRSPMRLFLRFSCTMLTGIRVCSCMASNAMRFPTSSRICKFAGRLAKSAWTPPSPIALLSKRRTSRLAGSMPASCVAPRSVTRFPWRASFSRFTGIRASCGMPSSESRSSRNSSVRRPAGRLTSNGPTAASVRPTSTRPRTLSSRFPVSCWAKRSAAASPRALLASENSSRSCISARASKYAVVRSSFQSMPWKIWLLVRFTMSKVRW
mmetsp:Transcript_54923/g.152318  ORF Transcript_54923/g.152318 Transcript_54923/m.152318 type:complete len:394 (-) Transcript_54923:1526-2707(-)